jgi:hypothetical protein
MRAQPFTDMLRAHEELAHQLAISAAHPKQPTLCERDPGAPASPCGRSASGVLGIGRPCTWPLPGSVRVFLYWRTCGSCRA